ncbi:hypothetical protein, partial [Trinickia sp.]|uniref:hypothetical protein n=1 Tax=Trinickia sp. TaxID=2571163 RepID=UPI003F7FA0B0
FFVMEFAVPAIVSTRGCWTSAGCTVDTWVSRTAESSGVAVAPPALFEPARLAAAALVSGLADVFAALVISAAAAEVRTAPELADLLPARPAVLAADLFSAETTADSADTTLRAGPVARFSEPRVSPLPAFVARPAAARSLVVFAIAISPLPQRSCFEKTN